MNRSAVIGLARRVVPPQAMRFVGRSIDIRDTARHRYGMPWLDAQRRAMRLQRDHGWTLAESLHAGLLDPGTDLEPERLVAPRRLTEAQEALNADSIQAVGEHKTLFRMFAAAAGIPVPETHATFMRGTMGWNWHTGSPVPPDRWAEALESLPDEFLIKPAEGYYGEGVRVLRRTGSGWDSVGEGPMTTAQVVDAMQGHPQFGDWLAQERLRNHPDLAPLGGEGLHTLRVVTITTADGMPELMWACFRLSVGSSVVDNYRGGALGNLVCEVDTSNGSVTTAWRGGPGGLGMERVEIHPTAGFPLAGLRIPLWDDAVRVALDAAPVFLPLRSLGFDIGLTPDGPRVVEMNMWWDLPYNLDARDLVARLWREAGRAPTTGRSARSTPPGVQLSGRGNRSS
ncbi:MAG: sugar-transfer associated ATP-grasp domain-containing protein [Thermoleophilia bacterium]